MLYNEVSQLLKHADQPVDDDKVLFAARREAREGMRKNRELESGSLAAGSAIEHMQGVARILRENVVQGVRKDDGVYKMNIHEHTQRLDNGTAKELKGTTKSFKEIKQAQF